MSRGIAYAMLAALLFAAPASALTTVISEMQIEQLAAGNATCAYGGVRLVVASASYYACSGNGAKQLVVVDDNANVLTDVRADTVAGSNWYWDGTRFWLMDNATGALFVDGNGDQRCTPNLGGGPADCPSSVPTFSAPAPLHVELR